MHFMQIRRSSHPSQPSLTRQSKVSDASSPIRQSSESKLSFDEDTITAQVPIGQSGGLVGKAASCSESKLTKGYFHSTEGIPETLLLEQDPKLKPLPGAKPQVTSVSSVAADESMDDETIGHKKVPYKDK